MYQFWGEGSSQCGFWKGEEWWGEYACLQISLGVGKETNYSGTSFVTKGKINWTLDLAKRHVMNETSL